MNPSAALASLAAHAAAGALVWELVATPAPTAPEVAITVALVGEMPAAALATPAGEEAAAGADKVAAAEPVQPAAPIAAAVPAAEPEAAPAMLPAAPVIAAPAPVASLPPPPAKPLPRPARARPPSPPATNVSEPVAIAAPTPVLPASEATPADFVTPGGGGAATGTEQASLSALPPASAPGWRLGSTGNPLPEYPVLARKRGWEGVVELAVTVAADGHVVAVEVSRSSGRDILDRAALETVRGWHFEPARLGARAVESRVVVPIRFRLADADHG